MKKQKTLPEPTPLFRQLSMCPFLLEFFEYAIDPCDTWPMERHVVDIHDRIKTWCSTMTATLSIAR
jgi:hypothetical protein